LCLTLSIKEHYKLDRQKFEEFAKSQEEIRKFPKGEKWKKFVLKNEKGNIYD